MRGFIFIDANKKDKFFDTCFDAYWKDNVDISKEENIKEILSNCKIDKKTFVTGIKDEKVKNELKNLTNLAFEKNIFGAPTFIVGTKMFFGQDRLEFVYREAKK